MRGWGHGTLIDEETNHAFASIQQSANLKHTHTGTAAKAGEHSHTVSGATGWYADSQGTWFRSSEGGSDKGAPPGLADNHTQKLTIAPFGDKETRPKAAVVAYWIKT